MARTSAQETIPGHTASTAAFACSTTSKPCSVRLGPASFSAVLLVVVFSSTEASQPCDEEEISRNVGIFIQTD
ncbi:unnamed protein product [Spirodela intermedia]|nr:unnamed protein product [Spirodela intermedia]CAA6654203.1 unnamed protein product [Spirodela intermedia]